MTAIATATKSSLASCRAVSVSYASGRDRAQALVGVSLEIQERDRLALLGRSGSGKTTLLHVLGGLVEPDSGNVHWRGQPLASIDAAARRQVRRVGIAYVFQGANLLPTFTAIENVAFAAWLSGETALRPEALLELVGLAGKADNLPAELSGGEAQRVAIARALAQQPSLVLCDEPTGHLDSDTADRVLSLVEALQDELGFALVVATHDPGVAARMDREVELLEGRIVRDERHP
jgi:lipoprotein-releasing system ATP-binding protein